MSHHVDTPHNYIRTLTPFRVFAIGKGAKRATNINKNRYSGSFDIFQIMTWAEIFIFRVQVTKKLQGEAIIVEGRR